MGWWLSAVPAKPQGRETRAWNWACPRTITAQSVQEHVLGSKPGSNQLTQNSYFISKQQQQWPEQISPQKHSYLVRNGEDDTPKRWWAWTHEVPENWDQVTYSYLEESTHTPGEIAKMLFCFCSSSFPCRYICWDYLCIILHYCFTYYIVIYIHY